MASWSVILARPYALDFDPQDFFAVAAQPLAGLLRSAYRAELFAIVTAMRFALVHRRTLRIWTDCQSAIDAFSSHVRDGVLFALMPNTAIFFGPCGSLPSKSVLDVLTP
jgi:hypothetical protein